MDPPAAHLSLPAQTWSRKHGAHRELSPWDRLELTSPAPHGIKLPKEQGRVAWFSAPVKSLQEDP
jgi:hypothetical protein